jgi:hypothetical protein
MNSFSVAALVLAGGALFLCAQRQASAVAPAGASLAGGAGATALAVPDGNHGDITRRFASWEVL